MRGNNIYLQVKGLIDVKGLLTQLNKNLTDKQKHKANYESNANNQSMPEEKKK